MAVSKRDGVSQAAVFDANALGNLRHDVEGRGPPGFDPPAPRGRIVGNGRRKASHLTLWLLKSRHRIGIWGQ